MARPNEQTIPAAFAPHLLPGEQLLHFAFGVKQPNMLAMFPLLLLGILPGVIAIQILTRNYFIGLTDRRFLVLQTKSMGNHEAKEVLEWQRDALPKSQVTTSTGPLFTHIRIDDPAKPFVAKFHRAAFKANRPHAMAIAAAIGDGGHAA